MKQTIMIIKIKQSALKAFIMLITLTNIASAQVQTPGSLSFTLTTPKHANGNYVAADGRFALGIWIETSTGTFVKTKYRHWIAKEPAGKRHLDTWEPKSGGNVVDANTGATLAVGAANASDFGPKTITWNGTDVAGKVVPDGDYRVAVEETWGHGTNTVVRYFKFTKGTTINNPAFTNDTNFTNITLKWTPQNLGVDDYTAISQANIYPNPSPDGIFNIEFKNQVNEIRVFNVLGKVVFDKEIEQGNANAAKIDLSSFDNGFYIVNVVGEKGISSYKIQLNR